MFKNKYLTSSSLKIIAIIVMFIDHFGASGVFGLLSNNYYSQGYLNDPMYILIRTIGRLAFPIFAFLIAEGFYRTHDKYKYLLRLGIFAFISEIPFDLAFYVKLPVTSLKSLLDFTDQNVFFTLALGLLAIIVFDLLKAKEKLPYKILGYISVLAIGFSANLLKTDYGMLGVLMIFCFYYFHNSTLGISISVIIVNLLLINVPLYYLLLGRKVPFIYFVQLFGILPLILIYFYNNKKGLNLKYFFYLFYPAHLLLLFCVKYLLVLSH